MAGKSAKRSAQRTGLTGAVSRHPAGVVGGLIGLAGTTSQSGFLSSLNVFQLLLAIAGVVLLALKPSNEWYKFRGWQRATGQG